jgi:hypothetical protein
LPLCPGVLPKRPARPCASESEGCKGRGDITAAFVLEGVGIGTGNFGLSGAGFADAFSFRIDTVRANGGVQPVPIPAALPLFAAGFGAVGLFGWRRKWKDANRSVSAA